jgi:hypothetical protein
LDVFDVTQIPVRVYLEDSTNAAIMNNVRYNGDNNVWMFAPNQNVWTDVFQGLRFQISVPDTTFGVDSLNTGWIQGDASINIQIGKAAPYYPYQYEIVFDSTQTNQPLTWKSSQPIYDVDGSLINSKNRVFGLKYPFYVINPLLTDSLGHPERLDVVLYDVNKNGAFDWDQDRILVGYPVLDKGSYWFGGTIFSFDFIQAASQVNPTRSGDAYKLSFKRPLSNLDSLFFTVNAGKDVEASKIKTKMDSIRVVPNPYIATNVMETAVANPYLNQRRQIMFTHVPANCVIRIFTPSGVLVDKIDVNNEPANGTVHWNLVSREGLEIAAGMYLYYVKSNVTGDEKIGKFAVIK